MLGALRISENCNAQSVVELVVGSVTVARSNALWIGGFGVQDEHVGAGELGKKVEMIQNVRFDAILTLIDDEVGVNVDYGASLSPRSAWGVLLH